MTSGGFLIADNVTSKSSSQEQSLNKTKKKALISPTKTVSPTMQKAKTIIQTSPTKSTQSSPPPKGNSTLGISYYTGRGTARENKEFSPKGAVLTLKHNDSGYTNTYTDSPSFILRDIAKGSYTLSLNSLPQYNIRYTSSVSGPSIRSQSTDFVDGSSTTIDIPENADGSVSFNFNLKSGEATSTDGSLPEITSVDSPVDIFNANSEHTFNIRNFCITLHVKDNSTPETSIETNVKLLFLTTQPASYIFNSGWTASKQHCFSNLANGDYQLEMVVRDDSGNIQSYASPIKVLSSQ